MEFINFSSCMFKQTLTVNQRMEEYNQRSPGWQGRQLGKSHISDGVGLFLDQSNTPRTCQLFGQYKTINIS